jgi:hypothetical protein
LVFGVFAARILAGLHCAADWAVAGAIVLASIPRLKFN